MSKSIINDRLVRSLCRDGMRLEAEVDELNDAICTLLHTGDELGEHSPRTHLKLFYKRERQKARAAQRAKGKRSGA